MKTLLSNIAKLAAVTYSVTVHSVRMTRTVLNTPAVRRTLTRLKTFSIITATAALIGCTSFTRYALDDNFDSSPTKTETKLTDALKCLGDRLERSVTNPGAYVFMVRDIVDGTVNNAYSDGPLADSGRIQMTSILTAHTKPSYAVVTDAFPMMFTATGNESIGLNRFSLPSQENIRAYVAMLTHFTNSRRKVKGFPAINTVLPLVIDGAFTRYDSSHIRSRGYGENAGYRGDSDEERAASFDLGNSGSERSITLVVNIIDPQRNMVVGTEGFDLKFYSNSKTARFRVAIDDFYYGLSNTDVRVETVHAAQQILLEAGAIWILDNAYGHLVDFSSCFDSDEKLALGRDARNGAEQNLVLSGVKVKPAGAVGVPKPKVRTNGNGQANGNGQPKPKVATAKAAKPAAKVVTPIANAPKSPPAPPAPPPPRIRSTSPVTIPAPQAVQVAVAQTVIQPAAHGWRVAVGIFANPSNVNRLAAKLRNDGYAPQSSNVTINAGTRRATLVWLGPFTNKKVAAQVSARMARFTGMKGYVTKDSFCERC